jgi:hypothetical protein
MRSRERRKRKRRGRRNKNQVSGKVVVILCLRLTIRKLGYNKIIMNVRAVLGLSASFW